jgi:hypothetical protein
LISWCALNFEPLARSLVHRRTPRRNAHALKKRAMNNTRRIPGRRRNRRRRPSILSSVLRSPRSHVPAAVDLSSVPPLPSLASSPLAPHVLASAPRREGGKRTRCTAWRSRAAPVPRGSRHSTPATHACEMAIVGTPTTHTHSTLYNRVTHTHTHTTAAHAHRADAGAGAGAGAGTGHLLIITCADNWNMGKPKEY